MPAAFDYADLAKPQVFAINRMPPHSDHICYRSACEARQGNTSLRRSLNGSWRFHFARGLSALPQGFEQPGYDVSRWDFINVPGHFETQGFGNPHYTNKVYPWEGYETLRPDQIPESLNVIGSYVTFFDKPEDWDNAFICFEGADSALAVWLNGHFVGYSEDSFTPAYFDLNPFLQDKNNRLCVQVFKYSSGSHLEDQDFWRISGLFRGVYLYTKPKAHFDDLKIDALLNEDFSRADIKVSWKAEQGASAAVPAGSVKVVLSYQGQELFSQTADISAGSCAFVLDKDLRLWSAEHPYLYELTLQVCDAEGKVCEYIEQDVGLRRFELKDGLMKLNGQRIVFNGVCRHEFSPRTGRTLTEAEIYEDLLLCKRYNINAVRTSHYPNNSCFYKFCDRLGLYVIDETNLETHGSWEIDGDFDLKGNTIPDDKPEWRDAVLARGEAMLERDKNHPCILLWSCGNESFGGKTIFEMSEYFRKTDPTRLVHYESIFHDRRYNATSDVESQMYTTVADVRKFIAEHPEKPFMLCEYTHAMGNSNGGMKLYTDMSHDLPLYQGGFIWDFVDQAFYAKNCLGEEYLAYGGDFDDRPTDFNFCCNAIFFADRTPSPKMAAVKANYQNFAFDFVNPGKSEDITALSVKITNYFLFTDLNEFNLKASVMLNGKAVYEKILPCSLPAGQSCELPLGLPEVKGLQPADTLCVNLSVQEREDTAWAPRGHEIACAQYVAHEMQPAVMGTVPAARLVISRNNCGVHGDTFSYLISKDKGGLLSLRSHGEELLLHPMQLNFWRAPTDNDGGNRMPARLGIWRRAGADARCLSMEAHQEGNIAVIELTHELAGIPEARMCSRYAIDGNGVIDVTLTYKAAPGLPDLPEFGILLPLKARFNQLSYIGRGPNENYCDRTEGALIGKYESTVAKEYAPYLIPQECGNHEHISTLSVTDAKTGHGLKVERGADFPSVSVLAWTPHELELAWHEYELPPVVKSVVKIAARPMGVGGDNSWGAPVLEPYLNHNKDYTFNFRLQIC